jgi:hypothetical protein
MQILRLILLLLRPLKYQRMVLHIIFQTLNSVLNQAHRQVRPCLLAVRVAVLADHRVQVRVLYLVLRVLDLRARLVRRNQVHQIVHLPAPALRVFL